MFADVKFVVCCWLYVAWCLLLSDVRWVLSGVECVLRAAWCLSVVDVWCCSLLLVVVRCLLYAVRVVCCLLFVVP